MIDRKKMNSKTRFFELLNQVPRIQHLWDPKGNGSLIPDIFEKELGVMSSGESEMAKFFAAVWFHDNSRYGFDVVDAMARVDIEHRELIANWIIDPFWP